MKQDGSDVTINKGTFLGELQGVSAGYSTETGKFRYRISPYGILNRGSRVTIENSVFQGHAAQGSMAFGDIINSNENRLLMNVINSQLSSQRNIIFGYPINGDSWIQVTALNGDSSNNFVLFRYDVNPSMFQYDPKSSVFKGQLGTCQLSLSYMATECQVT